MVINDDPITGIASKINCFNIGYLLSVGLLFNFAVLNILILKKLISDMKTQDATNRYKNFLKHRVFFEFWLFVDVRIENFHKPFSQNICL
jgi:hypothetical protein